MHRFHINQPVTSRSGTAYRVIALLPAGSHRKLNSEPGYQVVGQRGGSDFGPIRLMRDSALNAAPISADYAPE